MPHRPPSKHPHERSGVSQPGEVAGWPKLVVSYPTDPGNTARLLPPGLDATADTVQISVYCVPVLGEPEYGISVKIPARFGEYGGWYTLGIGIDQEAAIFSSRETNGQPKYPCSVRFYRLGDAVHASATHQGTTFFAYDATSTDVDRGAYDFDDHEWWVKVSRAVGTTAASPPAYDLTPQVVDVRSTGTRISTEALTGTLVLRDSAWDPIAQLLPVAGTVRAELVTNQHRSRSITTAGPLDSESYWRFTDTIGGSRWPKWAREAARG